MRDKPPLVFDEQAVHNGVDPEVPLTAVQPGRGVIQAHHSGETQRRAMNRRFERLAVATFEN